MSNQTHSRFSRHSRYSQNSRRTSASANARTRATYTDNNDDIIFIQRTSSSPSSPSLNHSIPANNYTTTNNTLETCMDTQAKNNFRRKRSTKKGGLKKRMSKFSSIVIHLGAITFLLNWFFLNWWLHNGTFNMNRSVVGGIIDSSRIHLHVPTQLIQTQVVQTNTNTNNDLPKTSPNKAPKPIPSSTIIDNDYRFNLDDRIKRFPCHYMVNRDDEFNIEPFYNQTLKWSNMLTFTNTNNEDDNNDDKEYDVSIVTIMSVKEKLFERLSGLVDLWLGPISIALFVETVDQIEDAKRVIHQFYQDCTNSNVQKKVKVSMRDESKIESLSSSSTASYEEVDLDRVIFHIVTDIDPNGRGKNVNVFPRNVLRNVAIDNSFTKYVLLLDIDLIISKNAYTNIRKHLKDLKEDILSNEENEEEEENKKHALVIPSFDCDKSLKEQLAKTKNELLMSLKNSKHAYTPFLSKDTPSSQKATNYKKWYYSSKMYEIDSLKHKYEPYVVIHKDANLQPLWEHFTGFGRNKLSWIEELSLSGHRFFVDPDTFLVHRWHPGYGIRRIRPFIADEYVERFQKYIKKVYGRNVIGMDKLKHWGKITKMKWHHLGTNVKSDFSKKEMEDASSRRNDEWKICMNTLNEQLDDEVMNEI